MKYIIVDGSGFNDQPILGSDAMPHSVLSNGLTVLAAGTVTIGVGPDGIQVSCSGKSVSLGKDSRGEEDERLILKMIERY